MYAANVGTFLQRDPLLQSMRAVLQYSHEAITRSANSKTRGSVSGDLDTNYYGYGGNNPQINVDPMGLAASSPSLSEPNNYRENGACTIEQIELFCSTMSATNHSLGYHCFLAIKKNGQWVEAISGGPGGDSGPDDTSRLVYKDSFEDINGLLNTEFWVEVYGKFTSIPAPSFLPGRGCTRQNNKLCDFYECAVKAAISLHDQYSYNSWHGLFGGRNSNWFISQVIKKCGGYATFPTTARMGENIPLPPDSGVPAEFWLWMYGGIDFPKE